MSKLPEKDLEEFFEKAKPTSVDCIQFSNDGKSIAPFSDSMCQTLKCAKREIYLEEMEFDDVTLKKVLESSAHVDRVVIKDSKLKIDKKYQGADGNFKFQELNMYGCFKGNQEGFEHFSKGQSKSKLKDHNFTLGLSEKDFPEASNKGGKKKGKGKGPDKDSEKFKWMVKEGLLKSMKDLIQNISLTYKITKIGDEEYEGQYVGDEPAGHGYYFNKKNKSERIHFCKDLIHQYEEITYPNGDQYKGYVRNGLKHGIGMEIEEDDKTNPIYALFIHGKLREEFSKKEADMISRGDGERVEYFKNNKKHLRYIKDGQKFERPQDFDVIMDEVEERIKEMKQ